MFPLSFKQAFGSKSEIVLVIFMMSVLLVLFTPVPAVVLDFLLIANFSFGLMVLLLTFYMEKPTEFSTFPTLLLMATLFRLSLNIAATRLILADADAGEVIGAIGEYVVGGNYVIGFVVFLILIVVQYVVVTNGAQRVAEVAARFTLDSMPGKQMSIDADMNMGLIDEAEAKERRKAVEQEANFYGAMDGASKFVKGDAIAGIIIILIDIVGGLTVGLAQKGMSWGDALQTYTLLTVGDGIVTQIPALVISVATGIIVTRAASDAKFGEEISNQLSSYPKSLLIASLALCGLLFMPGLPMWPVFSLLVVFLAGAYFSFKSQAESEEEEEAEDLVNETVDDQDLYKEISIDPVEIVVGKSLIGLVGEEEGLLMEKIKSFRKQFAMEVGFVFPSVRLVDDTKQDANSYQVKVYGTRVAEANLYPEMMLAISASNKDKSITGIETKDPTYGLPAIWIESNQVAEAKQSGYTLVDPLTVLITHFTEIIRNHAQELLTRAETEQVIQRVKVAQPQLLEELVPNIMSLSEIQKVLQLLLAEKVSIRNIEMVIEALVDKGRVTKDPEELTEIVRGQLGRMICESLISKDKELNVLSLDPQIEQLLQGGLRAAETHITLLVDPSVTEKLMLELGKFSEKMMAENLTPVLLCSPSLRRHIKKLVSRVLPHLSVLALTEIPNTVSIISYGIVKIDRNSLDRGRLPTVDKQANPGNKALQGGAA